MLRQAARARRAAGLGLQLQPRPPGVSRVSGISGVASEPAAPGISEVASEPAAPGISEVASEPAAPGISEVASEPAAPGISEVASEPAAPGISEVASEPAAPGISEVASEPAAPGISEVASEPAAPGISEVASEPAAPGISEVASDPAGQTPPGRLVDLASNDYLGLGEDERLAEAAACAARIWGTGATGSRLVTGTTELHTELERELAAFTGAAAALVFSSGYLANLAVITALAQVLGAETPEIPETPGPEAQKSPGVLIVSDAANHASLIDACPARAGPESPQYPRRGHAAR